MGTSSKVSDAGRPETLEDVRARLVLVEKGLSESQERNEQLDSELARQAQKRMELLTAENSKLKATRSELQFDLNACREDIVVAQQESLLLKHDSEGAQAVRRPPDRCPS